MGIHSQSIRVTRATERFRLGTALIGAHCARVLSHIAASYRSCLREYKEHRDTESDTAKSEYRSPSKLLHVIRLAPIVFEVI